MSRALLALALLVLAGSPAWGEGEQFPLKPDGSPPCNMYWDTLATSFNVYLKSTKTGAYIKVGSMPNPLATAPTTVSVPCPLTPGQYYWTVKGAGANGQEGPAEVAFVIVDPAAPTFAIGATVETTAYINVRTAPGMTAPLAGAAQRKASRGTITAGPTTVTGQVWWKIRYPSVEGWSSELYLVAVSTPSAGGWIRCADETPTPQPSAVCQVPYPTSVRWGATTAGVDHYSVKATVPAGPLVCNNVTFVDPAVGVFKHCDYLAAPPTTRR